MRRIPPEQIRDIYEDYGVRVVQVLDERGHVYTPAYVQLRHPSMDGGPNWLAPSQVKDWRAAANALALCVADLARQLQQEEGDKDEQERSQYTAV